MASRDLAKVGARGDRRSQPTRNRDTIIPGRRNTSAPDLEVSARILRPNESAARELEKILGLVGDTVNAGVALANQEHLDREQERAAEASVDFSSGQKNDKLFEDSQAYRRSWSVEAAKSMSTDLDVEVTQAVNERLADEEDPATLEDIDEIIQSSYKSKALGPDGKPLDFGSPQALRVLGNQMGETRARLIGQASEIIRTRTNTKLINTVAFNAYVEATKAKPIGADPVTGEDPSGSPQVHTKPLKSTGRLPIAGAITSGFHARAGEHNGVDIDGRLGDPVVAPATATVKKIGHDARNGNFVILDHGNGIETGYAHLQERPNLAVGSTVEAGAAFAKVGNTGNVRSRSGDGSHLHYTVRVNKKTVNPVGFKFPEGTQVASGEVEAPSQTAEAPVFPEINFEATLARVPKTVPRAEAKKGLLQAFLNIAEQRGDARMLDGLITSTQKDGSPSFSPAEIAQIQNQREAVKQQVEREADRVRKDRWDAGADAVLSEWVANGTVSRAKIQQMTAAGKLDPQFGFSLVNHIDAEERRVASEARAEERRADAEADMDLSMEVASRAGLFRMGIFEGATAESLRQEFNRGEFGVGKRAASHYNTLRAAIKEGGGVVEATPEVQVWAAKLTKFKPSTSNSLVMSALSRNQSPENYAGMIAHFTNEVKRGVPPAEAYLSAVSKYAPEGPVRDRARDARRQQLQAKRLQGGR